MSEISVSREAADRERRRKLREIDRRGAHEARKALHRTMKKRGYTVPKVDGAA